MKILVVNAGSSSLKYQLIDMTTEKVIAKGGCERVTHDDSFLVHKSGDCKSIKIVKKMSNHKEAFKIVLEALLDSEFGVIKSVNEIKGVGHRVVHSGEDFNKSVLVTDEVIKICERNAELAPLHMPHSNDCIKACRSVMPNTPMVLTFDTSFHSTMPKYAYLYSVPYEAYEKWKIRRYGFHGTSHRYVSGIAMEYLRNDQAKVITCHLGNGASMAAVKAGKSIDTTMGMTPLEGLTMGTRSGDIDPAVIRYLMNKMGISIDRAIDLLNKESGMLGISGISNDNRDLEIAAEQGNERAKLALDIFAYKVKRYIGAFAAIMGGVDAIVFTGGIGENSASQREKIMSGLEFIGAEFDKEANLSKMKDKVNDLSKPGAKVKTLVIPTNEELVIARDTREIIELNTRK
ncbi:MAG: acetate/propionate family kinase [Christensenellales bacterium]|jgi:acetate kinase